jgi:NAD(P)H-hydrate repair Nnr-like enzyme with NAD(P)H-hydrate dehydratase domain
VWTLHPRYFARLFKAKISYEAYPTEEEADALAARLPRKVRLIYDP